ncbi:hypothetical protein [Streptomyces sp. NPDC092307]|uniref:hypothetical protein n=1 Tax=Streptomyces sp. NPDC092307 TaxID=3366013 RepID=UPI0037FDF5B3
MAFEGIRKLINRGPGTICERHKIGAVNGTVIGAVIGMVIGAVIDAVIRCGGMQDRGTLQGGGRPAEGRVRGRGGGSVT